MKVIVTGSLGNISQPLAKELAEKGHEVTVISREPEKRKDIEAIGAKAAIGSLEDVDFLIQTFAGADAVYAMVPPNLAVPDMRVYYQSIAGNYAKAIQASGVKRVVHLSSYGAHLDKGTGLILGAHDAEGILNALLGVSVTHLRPGYFYYNLNNFTGMIKGAGIMAANYGGDDKMVMVAPGDIAAVAAEELITPAITGINIRYVASEELTCQDAACILGSAMGKPDLQWLTITNEQMQAGMEANGIPPHIAALFVELGDAIHSGILLEDYVQHRPEVMGKIKLADYAKEFAASL